MWLPSMRSIIFGSVLPRNEKRKQFYLRRVANHFQFNRQYPSIEVTHIIRSAHVVNVRKFREALIEYGYLEEDLYVSGRYMRRK